MHSYIFWALLGVAGYSFGTFFVKLAERGGAASAHIVLAVASAVVAICAIVTVAVRGEIKPLFAMEQGTLRSIAAGIALTVVVSSLFHALSLGSANVVVPI